MPRGAEWERMTPVKRFEGVEIRLDPETGKFGAHLGKDNLRVLKDLKALEREILGLRQAVRILEMESYRAGPGRPPKVKEIVRFQDGRYYFKDGGQTSYGLFEYDESVLRDMQTIEQEYNQLVERWNAVRVRMVALTAARYAELKKEGEP